MHGLLIGDDPNPHPRPHSHIHQTILDVVVAQMELGEGRRIHIRIESVVVCVGFTLDLLEDGEISVGCLGGRGYVAEFGVLLVQAQRTERADADELEVVVF